MSSISISTPGQKSAVLLWIIRRDRPDTSGAAAHSAGPNAAGCSRTGDHHSRCDRCHTEDRWRRVGIDSASGGVPLGVRCLQPLAAVIGSRLNVPAFRRATCP